MLGWCVREKNPCGCFRLACAGNEGLRYVTEVKSMKAETVPSGDQSYFMLVMELFGETWLSFASRIVLYNFRACF